MNNKTIKQEIEEIKEKEINNLNRQNKTHININTNNRILPYNNLKIISDFIINFLA